MNILIIEDNTANLYLLKRILSVGQHKISHFSRAEQALPQLAVIQPTLALVDIQLAGTLTGLDFVREVRKNGNMMPIIAMTAYGMDGANQKYLDAGCNDYIAKPFDIVQLMQLLKHYEDNNDNLVAGV